MSQTEYSAEKREFKIGNTVRATLTATGLAITGALSTVGRVYAWSRGANVASAGTITLPAAGTVFPITGTTAIDFITTTGWPTDGEVRLRFSTNVTLNHNTGSPPANTAPMLLSGAANFAATAGDNLTLQYNGAAWEETGRTVI